MYCNIVLRWKKEDLTALSKDKYRIEYTQSIKTFNLVTYGRKWANIFNQSKT